MHIKPTIFSLSSSVCRRCVVVAIALGLSNCGDEKKAPDSLARIGDKEITVEEFSRQWSMLQKSSPVPVDCEELLNEMINREVMIQAARKAGLADDPEVMNAMNEALIATLKARKLDAEVAAVEVTDVELRKAYELGGDRFVSPERVRLALLYVDGGSDGRQRVQAALDLAKTSAESPGFGAVAVKYSEDQETRYRGGDLGWIERGEYPKRIEAAVIEAGFALREKGQISEVIPGTKGFYLVKLLDRQPTSVVPLERVAADLRQQLLREKREQVASDFQRQLRDGLRVEVHAEMLQALPSPNPANEPVPPSL